MSVYVLFRRIAGESRYHATYVSLTAAKSAATQMLLRDDAKRTQWKATIEDWRRHHWRIVEAAVEEPRN